MSAVNFMVREFDNMGDPGFIRLLRAYLFAFPALVDFQADEMPQRFINQNTDDIHNAVQMAANNEEVPSNILCVLLEFGADVNCTTSSGESSMMGAIANVSDRSLFKLNLLLHYGGNIDIFDQSFQTVLHYGAYAGNVHGVRLVLKSRKQRLQITKYAVENLESGNGSSDESEKTSDVYSDEEEDRHETGPYGDTKRDPDYAEVTRRMYEDRLEVDMIHMDSPQTSFTPAMKYYAERLRLLSELYVDPLHLRDTCNHTPLSLAAGTIAMDFNERKKMVSMFTDAGADAEYDKFVGPSAPLREVSRQDVFFGFISCHERLGEAADTFFINVQIFKGAYRTALYLDIEFTNKFLDPDESIFPEGGMSEFNVEEVFKSCKGQRFDFLDRWDAFDRPHDGIDFSLCFNVTQRTIDENGDVSMKYAIVLETDSDSSAPDFGRFTMRFPRGPCPVSFWTNDTPPGFTYDSEITMHKHFTLLQTAAMCKYQETRRNIFTVARSLCNPLLKCDARYNVKGSTAAAVMETTLLIRPGIGRFDITQNARLLKMMQKDHGDMLHWIHKNSILQRYINVNSAFHTIDSRASQNNTQLGFRKDKRISPFHSLPDDVCQIILSFI
jgi:hypothetical protein